MAHATASKYVETIELTHNGVDEPQNETRADMTKQTKTQAQNKVLFGIKEQRQRVLILLESSRICPFKWKRNTFYCFYCNHGFADLAKLREHFPEHEDIKAVAIRKMLMKINQHEFLKVDITDVSCKLCSTPIDQFDNLLKHLIEIHSRKIDLKSDLGVIPFKVTQDEYKCALCDKKYDEYITLKHHMNVHYPNFVCETCGSGFISKERLRVHAMSHETGAVPCNECGKVFSSIIATRRHYESAHMRLKKYSCPRCPETFLHYYQRLNHISSAHGMKVKEFKCEHCPMVYINSGKLYSHIRSKHLRERRFKCEVCDAKFFSKSFLKKHMPMHSEERNFKCDDCLKAFKTSATLRTHKKTHLNDKPYTCNICGNGFLEKRMLRYHGRTRHPDHPNPAD